jgi:hypothetical protein
MHVWQEVLDARLLPRRPPGPGWPVSQSIANTRFSEVSHSSSQPVSPAAPEATPTNSATAGGVASPNPTSNRKCGMLSGSNRHVGRQAREATSQIADKAQHRPRPAKGATHAARGSGTRNRPAARAEPSRAAMALCMAPDAVCPARSPPWAVRVPSKRRLRTGVRSDPPWSWT